MKKLISVIFVFALCLSVACSGPTKEVTKSASEIYSAVAAAGKLGSMTPVPASDLADVYGIDASKIEDQAWYMSDNPSLNADEVGIFKLSDASYAAALAEILNNRIARQLSVAETYSPDEASKLKAASVVTAGNWVYFCVGEKNAEMMNVFNTEIG